MPQFSFVASRYPAQPGCYLMRDGDGDVIYVGKAKSLRHRLASYFHQRRKDDRGKRLIARLAAIEVVLVSSEIESLILENNLIKRHKPCFNRRLVDGESGYFYIALTAEKTPRLIPYRKNRAYNSLGSVRRVPIAKRFGPYVKQRYRDGLLAHVLHRFPVRTCNPMPSRVCLSYHLGRCCGVCEHQASDEEYLDMVHQAVAFLSCQHPRAAQRLRAEMWEHAEKLQFELAARMRDQAEALENGLEYQAVEWDTGHDQDVVFFGEQRVLVAELQDGAIQDVGMSNLDLEKGATEACEHFILSRYSTDSPAEIITNRLDHRRRVADALSQANGSRVRITLPQRDREYALVEFCRRNYEYRVSTAD